jgi:3-phenylpropionate/trans-cinnamate dioxygenase ferredoxin subunit
MPEPTKVGFVSTDPDFNPGAGYAVATVSEIQPGSRKIVEIAGRSIGVFNVAGQFHALRNRCPHQGGPLCQGRLAGSVVSSKPGEYEYIRDGEILRCPWHGWEFDIKTGQSWFDPAGTRVRTYSVTVESAGTSGTSASDRVKGPYVAETYDVTVEQELVVVHIREGTG